MNMSREPGIRVKPSKIPVLKKKRIMPKNDNRQPAIQAQQNPMKMDKSSTSSHDPTITIEETTFSSSDQPDQFLRIRKIDAPIIVNMIPERKKYVREERSKARKRFMEKVSIPGLVDLHQAEYPIIRRMWYIAYLASIVSVIYHTVLFVDQYQNQQSIYDYFQTDTKHVPFPKITVCVPAGVNKTWAVQHIKIPAKEKKIFDRLDEKGKEEFMDSVASLMHIGYDYVLERSFSPKDPMYTAYHHVITETDQGFTEGGIHGAFFHGALISCDNTISNCQLGADQYGCCENVRLQVDDYGSCFDLETDSMDLSVHRKKSPMSPMTFSFDLSLDWNHVPAEFSKNGFLIHTTQGMPLVLGQPITVPGGMHLTITISQPTWKMNRHGCSREKLPDTCFGPYDPNGYNCKAEKYMADMVRKYLGCQYAFGFYMPNETTACPGVAWLPMKMAYTYGAVGNSKETIRTEQAFRKDLFEIFGHSSVCQPLCQAWEYQLQHSYSEIMRPDYSSPDGGLVSGNVSKSRVTLVMGTSYYMERTEQEKKPFYDTFVSIAYVIGLYLGCSMITLAEVLFYSMDVIGIYWRTRATADISPGQERYPQS